MRGEQRLYIRANTARPGSPPLARGTVKQRVFFLGHLRITPACAGNRRTPPDLLPWEWDHPRLRGEQLHYLCKCYCGSGSPPLARGTEVQRNKILRQRRITPACAGNRYYQFVLLFLRQDHPRLRGEQVVRLYLAPFPSGSPPLARGTAIAAAVTAKRGGITPACAGNRNVKQNIIRYG